MIALSTSGPRTTSTAVLGWQSESVVEQIRIKME